jgi:class III poly(R)-hydroxyalkanoic acid synthase PhaE subunit
VTTLAREGDTSKEWMSSWLQWQRDFLGNWFAAAARGAESGMWPGQSPFDVFGEWQRTWLRSVLGPFGARAPEEGLGGAVFRRVLDAGGAYMDLVNVWGKTVALLAQVPSGTTLSTDKVKELYDQWIKDYQTMLESLWGAVPSEEVRETAKAYSNVAGTWAEQAWRSLEPVLRNLEQAPQILSRMSRGEVEAGVELTGLLRKNYEATLGKILRAPTIGFFRELSERANRTADAYVRFNAALTQYFVPFYQTGLRAGEMVFQRLMEFQGKEVTPETLREFYRIWWTINEDLHFRMFRSEEFTRLLGEVVRAGLLFKKQFDELSDEIIDLTNLPTKKEMDEVYRSMYELKKEVRRHTRAIEDLERRLDGQVSGAVPSGRGGAARRSNPRPDRMPGEE